MKRALRLAAIVIGLVLVAVAAYTLGMQKNTQEVDELIQQVNKLQGAELEAAIVKRVSQQMEDIAYQQKSISDEQRILAIEQSRLALENAHRAEAESQKAKELSAIAQQERRHAEEEKQAALEAEKESRKQRDEAEHQKLISDALGYRSISRSLGSASVAQIEYGNKKLASSLAFASYYFAKKCDANVYQSETYNALLQATDQQSSALIAQHSPVNAVAPTAKGCVAVTIYGDVVEFIRDEKNGELKSNYLVQDPRNDFRGVAVSDNQIWVLKHNGELLELSSKKTFTAPADNYFKLLELNDDEIILQGRKTLCWFSRKQEKFIHRGRLATPISCIATHNNSVYVFYANGEQSIIDEDGKIKNVEPKINEPITACIFDKDNRCYLGTSKGAIYSLIDDDKLSIVGHNSTIKDMLLCNNDLLITSAYDHTVKLWNLPMFQAESNNNKAYVQSSEKNEMSGLLEKEWLVPASYEFEGWPLAICLSKDGNTVWIGTSDGQVSTLSSSIKHMATILQKNVENLSTHEWQNYIGQISEPIDFKKVKL